MSRLLALLALASCADSWRYRAPEVQTSVEVVAPRIVSHRLDNAFTVYVGDNGSQLARVALSFRAGAIDAADPNLASIALAVLRTQADRALDRAAPGHGYVQSAAGPDASSLAATVLVEDMPAAVRALADLVLHPTCDPVTLGAATAMVTAGRLDSTDSIRSRSGRYLVEGLLGDHPWLRTFYPPPSTESCDAVLAWHAAQLGPARTALVVAGGVEDESVLALATGLFGGWQHELLPRTPMPMTEREPMVTFVEVPASSQTLIAVGRLVRVTSGDELVASTAIREYAGTLSSTLRVRRRISYGVSPVDAPMLGDNTIVLATASVDRANTAIAVNDFLDAMKATSFDIGQRNNGRWREQGAMAQRQMLDYQTVEGLAGAAIGLHARGRPPTSLQQELEAIAGLSWNRVQFWADKNLVPDAMHVVVLGDAEALAAAREQLLVTHAFCKTSSARCRTIR